MTLQEYIIEQLKTVIVEGGSADTEKFNYENITLNITDYIDKFKTYFNDNLDDDILKSENDDISKLSKLYYAPWTTRGWQRLMGESLEDGKGIIKSRIQQLKVSTEKFINLLINNDLQTKFLYKVKKQKQKKLSEKAIEKIKADLTEDNVITEDAIDNEEHKAEFTEKKDKISDMIFDYKKPLMIELSEEEIKKLSKGKDLGNTEKTETLFSDNENLVLEGQYAKNNVDVQKRRAAGGETGEETGGETDESPKVKCYVIDDNYAQDMGDEEIRQVNHRILFIGLMKYFIMICEKFTNNGFSADIKNIVDNIDVIDSLEGLYLLFFVMTLRYNDTINKGETVFADNDGVIKFVGKDVKDEVLRDFCIIALAVCTMLEANFISDEISKLINLTGLLSKK